MGNDLDAALAKLREEFEDAIALTVSSPKLLNRLHRYEAAIRELGKELYYLGFERPTCRGYGCCAKCGDIYSAEEALTRATEILKGGTK